MLKHTKIVATVSDQRCEVEFIDALYKAGMNVVRLNTAHMAEEGLTRVVNNVRTVSNRIGILMDTKRARSAYDCCAGSHRVQDRGNG